MKRQTFFLPEKKCKADFLSFANHFLFKPNSVKIPLLNRLKVGNESGEEFFGWNLKDVELFKIKLSSLPLSRILDLNLLEKSQKNITDLHLKCCKKLNGHSLKKFLASLCRTHLFLNWNSLRKPKIKRNTNYFQILLFL